MPTPVQELLEVWRDAERLKGSVSSRERLLLLDHEVDELRSLYQRVTRSRTVTAAEQDAVRHRISGSRRVIRALRQLGRSTAVAHDELHRECGT